MKLFTLITFIACLSFSTVEQNNTPEPTSADQASASVESIAVSEADGMSYPKRKWWAVALADAVGALGGAVSGSALGPGGTVAGGIIGGVAGSAGAADGGTPGDGDKVTATNDRNNYDYVGSTHNQIIRDYYAAYDEVSDSSYIEFINNNKDQYGIEEVVLNDAQIEGEYNAAAQLNSKQDFLDYLRTRLPNTIDKDAFLAELSQLLNISDRGEFVSQVIDFENRFFAENDLNELNLIAMKAFFSTIRHSAALWN